MKPRQGRLRLLLPSVVAFVVGLGLAVVGAAPANAVAGVDLTITVGTDAAVCGAATSITVAEGDEVFLCYTVLNTGDEVLDQHDLVSSLNGTLLTAFPFALIPGASAPLIVPHTVTATVTETATWTGTNTTIPSSASDTSSLTITMGLPDLEVDVTVGIDPVVCGAATAMEVPIGTTVQICYTITNTGVGTLTHHDATSSSLGVLLDGFPFTLGAGASTTLIQPLLVTADVTESMTWTAFVPSIPGRTATSTDSAVITIDPPEIQVVATVGTDPATCEPVATSITVSAGDEVAICYLVTNLSTSAVHRHDLTTTFSGATLDDFPFTLPGGDSTSLIVVATVSASVTETGTWQAWNTARTDLVTSGQGTVTITVAAAPPSNGGGAAGSAALPPTGLELEGPARNAGLLIIAGTVALLVGALRRRDGEFVV